MNTAQFLEMLSQAGYPDPIEVLQPPNGSLGEHSHPFAVKALVVEGSIQISIAGRTQSYGAGDIFELADQEAHAESYGPHGVRYLASRK
jgi:quercetin dioxygenase-like cupin family protein